MDEDTRAYVVDLTHGAEADQVCATTSYGGPGNGRPKRHRPQRDA
jgi:hypothetical protein